MNFGQACAAKPASCQACICFGSEVDLLNMFGPVSELDVGQHASCRILDSYLDSHNLGGWRLCTGQPGLHALSIPLLPITVFCLLQHGY